MSPDIAVIIPAFNRGWQLKRALESLVYQTDKNFEVIVCDDGSTEDIQTLAGLYSSKLQMKFIRIENSGGPARPRNVAAAYTNVKWLSFLDSDDWWDKERISIIRPILNDDVDLVYHSIRVARSPRLKASREKRGVIGNRIKGDALSHMLLFGNPIPNSSVVLRNTMFKKIRGFSEDQRLSSLEDFDAWLRVAEAGGKIEFLNKKLGYYWIGEDSISSISKSQITKYNFLFKRHRKYIPLKIKKNVESINSLTIATLLIKIGGDERRIARKILKEAYDLPGLFYKLKRLIKLLQCYI